jgi:hypothetical protein
VTTHPQFLAIAGIVDGKRAGLVHVWALNRRVLPKPVAALRSSLAIGTMPWDG